MLRSAAASIQLDQYYMYCCLLLRLCPIYTCYIQLFFSVKPVLSGHSNIDKTKVLKTNGILMKVESIAECSFGAFCNTFDLHKAIIGRENQFFVFFLSGRLRQVLLYIFIFNSC